MSFVWVLFAMPLAAILYFGWVITWEKPVSHAISYVPPSPSPKDAWWRRSLRARTIKWISSAQLTAVTQPFAQVLVVDLRSRGGSRSYFLENADYLHINPDEFCDVLRWIPANTCVVLIGPAAECTSMIMATIGVGGHAPIFVVTDCTEA